MSRIVEIADAVTAALNAGPFDPALQAVRSYQPGYELEQLKQLRVTVVPRGMEQTGATRAATQRDIQIDIGIQKKLTQANTAEVDALLDLVQQMADYLRTVRQFGPAIWVKTENTPIYSVEHLEQFRGFTSVLTLTLRTVTT
ncbi:MAG: hypothetical protein ACYC26_15515 [Phycisphaerales bacterium]